MVTAAIVLYALVVGLLGIPALVLAGRADRLSERGRGLR
jgi:hypothetical protein